MSVALDLISDGHLGLMAVDPDAVGYSPDWQAPGGADLGDVAIADYDADSAGFACQLVSGQIQVADNVTSTPVEKTLCAGPAPAPTVIYGEPTYTMVFDYYQDVSRADGLSAWLQSNRADKAYLYFAANGDAKPQSAIGVVYVTPGQVFGGGSEANRSTVTLTFVTTPDISYGVTSDWKIVHGDHSADLTGATWPPAVTAAAA